MATEIEIIGHGGAGQLVPAAGYVAFDLVGAVLAGLAARSAEEYRKDFEAFRRFVGAASAEAALWGLFGSPPGEANAVLLAWRVERERRGLAAASVRRGLAALKRAVKRGRLLGMTTLAVEVDAPRTEAFRDVRGPGADGWERLRARAEADAAGGTPAAVRNLALVLLLHDRGLRRAEAVALDYPRDIEPGPDAPAVWVRGKGKSERERLTINEPTRAAVVRWLDVRGVGSGPLFVRADPGAGAGRLDRLTGHAVNRIVGALGGRAGLPRAVRAHGLRHCAITTALDNGYDVRDVKAFSRHARIDTVLIYDDRRKDVGGEITRSLGAKGGASGRVH